jgi:hypothetical protein
MNIAMIIPIISAADADTTISTDGHAPAKKIKKTTNIQYNINIYPGKNNIVSGKNRTPIKSQINIMIATIIIPPHAMTTPTKIRLREDTIAPKPMAAIQPITLKPAKMIATIKQIIPKQNIT